MFETISEVQVDATLAPSNGERQQIGCALRSKLLPVLSLAAFLIYGCAPTPVSGETKHGSYIVYDDPPPKLCNSPAGHVLASVVRVATDDGADASGVVVARDRVLTAAHVVVDAGITLVGVDDEYREASVLAIDQISDLALLSVATGPLKPVPLSHNGLGDDEEVWAIGFPFALHQVTTHGLFRNEAQGRLFASAPINAGASGGGLMRCKDGAFELAGLIRGYGAHRVGDELIRLSDLSIHTPADQIQSFVFRHDGVTL